MLQKGVEMSSIDSYLKSIIRDVPDFPKPGIIFRDITPILSDNEAFRKVVRALLSRYTDKKITAVVVIESRGFLFGAPVAYELGASLVPLRKKGKLPYKTVETSYDLEYGTAAVEMHIDAINKGDRVLVIDDLLATGGTAAAACELVEKQGGTVVECAFVVELGFLNGRKKLKTPVFSLVRYN